MYTHNCGMLLFVCHVTMVAKIIFVQPYLFSGAATLTYLMILAVLFSCPKWLI